MFPLRLRPFALVFCFSVVIFLLGACATHQPAAGKTIGSIERLDPALNNVITGNAVVEIIAEGHEWSEGPLWLPRQKMLIYSDVPRNSIYKWTQKGGATLYMQPSGYTSAERRRGETGSNGLALDNEGRLLLCQHGDRRIARMVAPLNAPAPVFSTVAASYDSKKFNSPNDLAVHTNGDIYFTDPPYGLEKHMEDPKKETPYQGVYKVKSNGKVVLLTDSISRPNGIVLTPDGKTLIVANSDGAKPYWYAYDVNGDSLNNGRLFYDATAESKQMPGGNDGLKIDSKGNVFATGPGGVWIFNAGGKVLGRIRVPAATSNCALSDDEKTLFITADMYVLRVKMR